MMHGIVFQLNVNDDIMATVYDGDAIIFTLTISYPDAIESRYHNISIDERIAKTKERYEAGELTEEEYKREIEDLEKEKVKIESIKIGARGKPWVNSVEFLTMKGDKWVPLKWKLTTLDYSPEEDVVELSGDENLYAEIAVDPEYIAKKIPEGDYAVKAKISGLESNAVAIKVVHKESQEDLENRLGRTARYHIQKGDTEKARKVIDGILKVVPGSILGWILMAELYERMNDLDKALDALKKAREEFYRQNPDSVEPPRYIDSKITRLEIKKTLGKEGETE